MNSFKSFAQKLVSLPKAVDRIAIPGGKAHLKNIHSLMLKHLRRQTLVKPPLSPITINKKRKDKKPYTVAPLLGFGNYIDNSMINGLEIKGSGKKWKLIPTGKHYSGLNQSLVWAIHEFGAVRMIQTEKGNKLIKIPPRKPLREGLKKYLRSVNRMETNKLMIKTIKEFILSNNQSMTDIDIKFADKVSSMAGDV